MRAASFYGAALPQADFSGATCRYADFSEAYCWYSTFEECGLRQADFRDANLQKADLSGAVLRGADFSDADLRHTDFTDADLREADFTGATATDAIFENGDLRQATFADANLEGANLDGADIRDASLRNARLFQTILSDVRINLETEFGASIYESESFDAADEITGERDPLSAAAWTYRRLEELHERNAMSNKTRQFHIKKEEAQRRLYRKQRQWGKFTAATVNRYLTFHGESLSYVLLWWAIVVLGFAFAYPFAGGVTDGGTPYQLTALPELFSLQGVNVLLRTLYFSATTFTTIGYANVAPHGVGSRVLVGIESLLGGLLIALFVFVLSRRVAR